MLLGNLGLWVESRHAQAQASTGVELSVERCAYLPFDVEAYAHAVEVELLVLNAAALVPPSPGGVAPKLSITEPGCGDELSVTLRVGELEAVETLHASDFTGVGQPRALALATIEALRVLSLRLQALAGQPKPSEPAPASLPAAEPKATDAKPADEKPADAKPPDEKPAAETAADKKLPEAKPETTKPVARQPKPQPKATRTSRPAPTRPPPTMDAHARAAGGLFGAHDLQLQAGFALALVRPLVWVDASLAYGHSLDRTALGALRASEVALAATLELRLHPLGPIELAIGAGLRGGAAWASRDIEPALVSGRSASTALGPVLAAILPLTLALEIGAGAVFGLFVEPGYGLIGARFIGPTASDVGMATLAQAARPTVELLGPSLYAGLMLGYRFE